MRERSPVTRRVGLEVAAILREQAAAGQVSEGEIVERALWAADLRVLVGRIRDRSDLDGEAAMRLVDEELEGILLRRRRGRSMRCWTGGLRSSAVPLCSGIVDHHVSAILRRLDARTRGEAAAAAARLGLLENP